MKIVFNVILILLLFISCSHKRATNPSSDTAFVIGKVSRFEDITGDSIPELYTWELVEYGKARAFDKFENIIVTIENDSLSYPYP